MASLVLISPVILSAAKNLPLARREILRCAQNDRRGCPGREGKAQTKGFRLGKLSTHHFQIHLICLLRNLFLRIVFQDALAALVGKCGIQCGVI
jgi:hypothetical protein